MRDKPIELMSWNELQVKCLEQRSEIERLRDVIREREIEAEPRPRFRMDREGNLTRIED